MTITTRSRSKKWTLRMTCRGMAYRVMACLLTAGVAGRAAAQTYAPATAPPSPADIMRQSTTVQASPAQTASAQGIPMLAEGGTLPISVGDLIDVQVFATPELSGSARVDQNGDIVLPVGGKVHLAGETPTQAAITLQDRLKSGQIMIDPHIRVFTVQYAAQGVTVLGEVARPGTYSPLGIHTLWDALAAAAGLTSNAGKTITIAHHQDPTHPDIIPLSSLNYNALFDMTPVSPGDSIVVARADTFYVIGDVGRTGEFPLINGRPNTILTALAVCGGVNKTAKMGKTVIVRTTPAGVITIPLDLKRIMKNTAPNPVLQASDVLVVPRSDMRAFLDGALANASQTVTSVVLSSLIVR